MYDKKNKKEYGWLTKWLPTRKRGGVICLLLHWLLFILLQKFVTYRKINTKINGWLTAWLPTRKRGCVPGSRTRELWPPQPWLLQPGPHADLLHDHHRQRRYLGHRDWWDDDFLWKFRNFKQKSSCRSLDSQKNTRLKRSHFRELRNELQAGYNIIKCYLRHRGR